MNSGKNALWEEASEMLVLLDKAKQEIGRVIIGMDEAIHLLFVALLARGHAIAESTPGQAKTKLMKAMAAVSGLHYGREITEGHVMSDHVHMLISIPPKFAVSSIIGFLKGKSAITIARQFSGKQRNFMGEHFWARGYIVSTVGFNVQHIQKYIRNQEGNDQQSEGSF